MYYYKKDGTLYQGEDAHLQWSKDFNNPKYKIIEQTKLPNGVFISTVWLGIDIALFENFPLPNPYPLIFETMVFSKGKDADSVESRKYITEKEARRGHARLVKKWSKKK